MVVSPPLSPNDHRTRRHAVIVVLAELLVHALFVQFLHLLIHENIFHRIQKTEMDSMSESPSLSEDACGTTSL